MAVYDIFMVHRRGIAIGNQTCNPTWELLAIAPINKQIPIIVTIFSLTNGANEKTVL